MKRSQLFFAAIFLVLLLTVPFVTDYPINFGAVPWHAWVGLFFFTLFIGLSLS
jgi:hypothetical protein